MGIKEIAQRKEAGTRMGFIIDSEKTGGILAGHGQDMATGMNVFFNLSPDEDGNPPQKIDVSEIATAPEFIMDTHQPEIEAKLKALEVITEAEGGQWIVRHEDFVRLWKMYHSGAGEISPQEYAYTLFYSQNEDPEKRARVEKIVIRHTPRMLVYFIYQEPEEETPDQKKRGRSTGRPKKKKAEEPFTVGIHNMAQLFNEPRQRNLFSDNQITAFMKSAGIYQADENNTQKKPPPPWLNVAETRVFFGLMKAFSDTQYMGTHQVEKLDEFKERGINVETQRAREVMKTPYRNINQIPVLQLTQADIIRLSGYDSNMGDKQEVIKALGTLGMKQFAFFWKRLEKDEKGKPVKDKSGDFKREVVMEVGTYFRIKTIFQDNTNILKHYEISPSAVILDQVNDTYGGTYYLIIPGNWNEEIKKLTGRRATPYTYFFLLWLRMKFEEIRQFNNLQKNKAKKKPFVIKKSWEEIAQILYMPESMYKLNRKRAQEIIEKAYTIATRLGYLLRVENDGAVDVLYLNEEFFPQGRELV